MKKIFMILATAAVMVACGAKSVETTSTTDSEDTLEVVVENADTVEAIAE